MVAGSVTHQNPWNDPNDLDFAVIAYDSEGNRRWSIRWPPRPGWRRGDLWAAAWDNEKYLILAGSGTATTIPPDTRKCFLLKFFVPGVTSVKQVSSEIPIAFALSQNYPNPFNPTTTIEFALPERSFITLKVMNILGQEIQNLVSEVKEPGTYRVQWNACHLPSGVYFYRLETTKFLAVRKMILLK